MNQLDQLESTSVHIMREAYRSFRRLCMLWSIGKDSTVMLWLARKAFFGHVPFTLVHIDTSFKLAGMLAYRDRLAVEWGLSLVFGRNDEALRERRTFPDGALDHTACCNVLKTEALRRTLSGEGTRYRLDLASRTYKEDPDRQAYEGVFVGVRADEEGSRSKERYFSPRSPHNAWDVTDQPPEFWNQYATEVAPGTHVRVHPLLDWTETNLWEYIDREHIPTVDLYYDHGQGERYRSLGCAPCTKPVCSSARTPAEIVVELRRGKFANVAERAGRAQDAAGGGLEALRRDGYM
jgi:sulfate adenylyltransferase subunit 2